MHRGHDGLLHADAAVHDLHHRRDVVGGAAGAGDDVRAVGAVDAVHDHRHVGALGRAGDDHLVRAGRDVLAGVLDLGEEAGALKHQVDVQVPPGKLRRVALAQVANAPAVDDQVAVIGADLAVVTAVNRIVANEIGEILDRAKVVDRHQFQFRACPARP